MNYINEFTTNMITKMREKRETFIKEKLIEKGYPELSEEIDKKVRFSKVKKIILNQWEYIFVDNGTKHWDFIVAIGPWQTSTEFDYDKAACETTCKFQYQDTLNGHVKL